MVTADWIAIAVLVGTAALGALLGFGRGLKFFTSGIFGVIISIFLCYCLGGMILGIPFMQKLMVKFSALWTTKEGGFYSFLEKIHIEIVVYYVALFIVFQILRIILVKILKHVVESKFILIRVINKTLGAALFAGMALLIALFVFQIMCWVEGPDAFFVESKIVGPLYRFNLGGLLKLINPGQG